ncbi:MAG TPA: site-2 protease family protein, partial [Thermoanaerobaculia bacterium]|nr:site-2 protease family protein [Thermoanaerobaculia bacterium]
AAATVALVIAVHVLGPAAQQAATLTILAQFKKAGALAGFPLVFTLVELAYINAFLGLFNMIPLPPLDGGQIALYLLPPDWAAKYAALRPYGFTIGIFLAVCGVLTVLLLPFSAFLNLVVSF